MKIILLEDVMKLGKAGELVKVSPGYGRNYLLPKRLAIMASPNNMKRLDAIRKAAEEKSLKLQNELKAVAQRLQGTELNFVRKADENGHLFGSVSDIDMVKSLKEKGFDINKNMIEGETHIKNTGVYDTKILLAPDIEADIKVNVISEEEKVEE